MISNLIDILANFVIQTIDAIGYAGIFILMALESCGIPIPSEVIMPFSGFLVAQAKLNFWLVAFLGALGNLAGSVLAYYIGSKGGRPLIEKYGKYFLISEHDLNIADKWFKNYGPLTAFFGRLLPVIRTYISFPAGIAKMDIKKFSFYTFIGALPWCILFSWLGVKLGQHWDFVREKLHSFDLAIMLLIILAIALYIWRHLNHLKQDDAK